MSVEDTEKTMSDRKPASRPQVNFYRRPKMPGKLEGGQRSELHTREAVALLYGRSASAGDSDAGPITGLNAFSARIHLVYLAARHDNPFARWLLAETEERMDAAVERISEAMNRLSDVMESQNLLENVLYEIDDASSVTPVPTVSRHGHYYSSALRLLRDFDGFVRKMKSYLRHNLVTRDMGFQEMDECAALLRSVFASADVWPKNLPFCDRTQLENDTPAAKAAVIALGKSGFLQLSDFPDMEAIFDFYVTHGKTPRFGPSITEVNESGTTDPEDESDE